jgi:hypothetical protein
MEKSYYIVLFRSEYFDLLRSIGAEHPHVDGNRDEGSRRAVLRITQGGFGQDVVDDELQVKERFLEYLFSAEDIDLPRTPDVFDRYFCLETADEFIDLDEEI